MGDRSDARIDGPSADEIVPHREDKAGPNDFGLPPLVLGSATFGYGIYAETSDLHSNIPLQVIRYAFQAGMTAIDTAPFYHPSEVIIGDALEQLRDEFPRSSYKLITKAGKYGKTPEDHRYDKKTIRESVQKSLERFKTDYLDVVYLHDVESISSVLCPAGKPLEALNDLKADSSSDPYKLRPPHRPLGAGDEQILEGLRELRALQKEGKILHIGIAAYPLPIILRIALLAKADPSVGPLDIIQTYTHQTIQNAALEGGYLQAFDDAGVKQVMNASPLAMGLLTSVGPPEWHQAIMQKTDLAPVSREASELCKQRGTTLEEIAAKFGSRKLIQPNGNRVPVVIGCKNVDEVKRAVATWRAVNVNGVDKKTQEDFKAVMELFESRGVKGYSYRSL